MRELIRVRDELKSGNKKLGFFFFEIGGSGQSYSAAHVELMREIQKLGGKIGSFTGGTNKYGDSAILLAVIHKDYEFIQFLLENGANPSEPRYNGACAFDYAHGDPKIAELLDGKEFDLILRTMDGIQQVYPHIFISSEESAENEDILRSKNISAILRVTNGSASDKTLRMYGLMGIDYYHIAMFDQPCFNISKYFEITNKIIKTYCSDNEENILVHCAAGISRSPTIVASYLLTEGIAPVNSSLAICAANYRSEQRVQAAIDGCV